jgi:hypothetical protein
VTLWRPIVMGIDIVESRTPNEGWPFGSVEAEKTRADQPATTGARSTKPLTRQERPLDAAPSGNGPDARPRLAPTSAPVGELIRRPRDRFPVPLS